MAYEIQLAGATLAFQPTPENYSITVNQIGNTRRTLSGKLDRHVVTEKREWQITVPEQGLMAALTPYLRTGLPVAFKDVDGTEYIVHVSEIPVDRYPFDLLGEVSLKLEEE